MDMYRVSRMPDGSHVVHETTFGDEVALGAVDAAGWLGGAGIDGLAGLARRSQDRKLMKAVSELEAASESGDAGYFYRLAVNFTERYPTEEYGHATLAEALQENGRYDSAISSVDRAVELGLGAAESHMLRAGIYRDADRTGKALHEFTLLAQTPEARDHPELRQFCLVSRAALLLQIGDLDQALVDSNQAIAILPQETAYFIRGHVYRRKDELGKAIDDYTRAIQLNPDEPNFFGQRAEVYEEFGKSADAAEDRRSAEALTKVLPAAVDAPESSPATDPFPIVESPGSNADARVPIALSVAGGLFFLIGVASGIGLFALLGLLLLGGVAIWLAILKGSSTEQHQQGLTERAPASRPTYPPRGDGPDWGYMITRFLHVCLRILIGYLKFCWLAASAITRAFR